MQTHFTPAQLADPDNAASEKILRACVHCGFCTATCPTYRLLGDELDSPRGRISLIKEMLEQGAPATARVVRHVDRCLSCLGCMTTCPSSVHYMHLVDHARKHIEQTYSRPLADRLRRWLLAFVLPHAGRFQLALRAARLARPFRALLPPFLRRLLAFAPSRIGAPLAPATHEPDVARIRRVALLAGCVQPALRPQIDQAAIRLMNRRGVEVVVAEGAGCCGALTHHMGREAGALALARANIDAWMAEIERGGLDAIIVTASGCGTMLKDYGHLFRDDPAYAAKAATIAGLARDVTELVAEVGLGPVVPTQRLAVAYHSACSLTHGQRVVKPPRELLAQAGFDLREVPQGHLCCGSAGTYNLLQPEIANRLRDDKVAAIESTGAELIAAGNIGCLTQIAGATKLPTVHTVELLDWATGGPKPTDL